jgi:hypothetical protein
MELIDGPSLDHVVQQLRASGAGRPMAGISASVDGLSPDLAQTGPYVESAGSAGTAAGLSSSGLGSGSGYFDTVARLIAGALHRTHRPGLDNVAILP